MRLTVGDTPFAVPVWRSPIPVVVLTAAALLAVFALDRATGAAPFQHLYYLPIILAAIRFKRRGGAVAALSAIALYHAANPRVFTLAYEESDIVQIVLFLATGAVTGQLARDAERLHRLATTDDLTGLHNLRSFEVWLASMVHDARKSGTPLAMLVLDLDRLKSLNDSHGHLTGAEAVRTVGRLIAQIAPPEAVACRYGGDEFVMALPRSDPPRARQLAEHLCQAVHAYAPVLAGRSFAAGTLSVSVGLACATFVPGTTAVGPPSSDAELGEALFREADAALYRAKAQGRNRVADMTG